MDNEFTSPVYGVKAVPVERIRANSYNPNVTAPPEMRAFGTLRFGGWVHDAVRVLLH